MACNSIVLNSLDASCWNSLGGIKEVYLIPYTSISGEPAKDSDGLITGLTYVSGTTTASTSTEWRLFKFRKNTGSMVSTLSMSEFGGAMIETILTMQFSKMQNASRTEMMSLALGEVAAVVCDSNNTYWYLGYENGVTTDNGQGNTGVQKTDGNYYEVQLKDESTAYPHEVEATLAAAIKAAAYADANSDTNS